MQGILSNLDFDCLSHLEGAKKAKYEELSFKNEFALIYILIIK